MKNILYSIVIAAAMTCNILPAMAQSENVKLTLDDTPQSYEAFRIGVWSHDIGTKFDITYTRNTNMQGSNNGGTLYGTLCLPFYINAKPTDMKLYYFGNIHDSTLDIVEVPEDHYTGDGLYPGTPLIFKLNNAATSMSITCNGTKVNKYGNGSSIVQEKVWTSSVVEESAVFGADGYTVLGALYIMGYDEKKTITERANNYYYIYNDHFYKAETELTVNPFRVVMEFNDQTQGQGAKPSVLSIREVPAGSTNAISTATATASSAVGIYSINGSKQTAMRRGINIVRQADGTTRKVVVK